MSTHSFDETQHFWTQRGDADGSQVTQQLQDINEPEAKKWTIQMIIRLLRLYGAHRCLWDVVDEDFRNRSLRKAALVDLAAAIGYNTTTAQVVQKINVLRATYRYEKKRIKQRMRKGKGATTKLKWFALADSFLRNVPKIGKIRKRCSQSDTDSELENEMVLTIDPEAVIPYETEHFDNPATDDFVQNHIKTENATELSEPSSFSKISSAQISSSFDNSKQKEKQKWSSEHTLRFVQLLMAQTVLWSEKLLPENEKQRKALETLACQMGITTALATKKLKIFRETCEKENLKIVNTPNYKPPYIWWKLAESFMPCINNLIDFVDTNAVMPATPMPNHENPQTPLTPINPLPSVLNPTVYADNPSDDEDVTVASASKYNCFNLEDDLLEGKWSLKHSVKFLRLYGSHPCLWDLNHSDYRCRELRAAAIADIAAAMGHGLDADYVAKKIKIFRITYMQHRKRILAAIKAGQEPEIQLRWFPLADSFLRPHIGLRSIKEQTMEIPQFSYQYVMANLNLIDPELLNDFR